MNILLGFAPFVVFFALMRLVSPAAGLVAALVVSLALCLRSRWRGEAVKVLEIGSAVGCALLTAWTLLAAPHWTVATVRLAVDGGLLAIVLVSLAIGRPFTLPYAREQVPQQFWALPLFLATNRAISAVWGLALAVLVAADAAAEYVPAVPLWFDIAGSIGALVGAIWFTRWYPARVRRRAIAAAGGAA